MTLEKINEKIDQITKKRDKAMNEFNFDDSSFEDWNDLHAPFTEQLAPLFYEKAKLERLEWEELDDLGDLMTMEDWIDCVKSGGFIDYDGHGYYSDGKRESNKIIHPSDVRRGHLLENEEFTHVVWYNR